MSVTKRGDCHCCNYKGTIVKDFSETYKDELKAWGWRSPTYDLCAICAGTYASVIIHDDEASFTERRLAQGMSYIGNVILEAIKVSTPNARR